MRRIKLFQAPLEDVTQSFLRLNFDLCDIDTTTRVAVMYTLEYEIPEPNLPNKPLYLTYYFGS